MIWETKPAEAWLNYIQPYANAGWIEESTPISKDIDLSKRELFALIVLAHMRSAEGVDWIVGYDSNDSEPNDGYVSDGKEKINCEHKVVAQFEKAEVLELILQRYRKISKLGPAYGSGRVLVIHPNKAARGLVKISDLTKEIDQVGCPFDKVLTLGCLVDHGEVKEMKITQHYPKRGFIAHGKPAGMSRVDFNVLNGTARVPIHTVRFE